ncbi:MAG TPA: hypothetical protein VH912_28110 [Streptosporangiaceae bacterium]|jgi:hypothetical protein
MQFIEVGVLGVRSAVITLRRSGSPMRFVLFPMIHLGSPEFYAAVAAEVRECDLVVAEGQPNASRRRRLTLPGLTYLLLRRYRRSRLVVQRLNEETLGPPVIRPDLNLAEIRRRLRRLPLFTWMNAWLAMSVRIPWVALFVLIFGPERFLTHHLALDDDAPPLSPDERWAAIHAVIVDDRDALLLDALTAIHEERGEEAIDVAVVYGAGHMRAVVHGLLNRHGYRARQAHWLTVFDLDD